MNEDQEIIIVSGLPRCGTSLMMRMLDLGGVPVLVDNLRVADTDNPRGYYEFEPVKTTEKDASWVPSARGKAVKMVSQLLQSLPDGERYRVIFMERDMDEMLRSQDKMLERLGRPSAPKAAIEKAFTDHLARIRAFLAGRADMEVLYVNYNELMADAASHVARISAFLGGRADAARMIEAVDPSLYRNRKPAPDGGAA